MKELDRSTSEARDAIYERARTALIAHLRLNQAGLLKADIVKERLALEGAIREAEAARKSRTEMPTALRPKTPPASTPNVDGSSHRSSQGDANPGPADVPEARLPAVLSDEQSLGRQSLLEAVRGSLDVVSEVQGFAGIIGTAAQTGPHARQVREKEAVDPQALNRVDFDKRQERDHGPYGSENEQLLVVPPLRLLSRSAAPEGVLAPELAIRADVTIPERRMAMTWSLRRNTEKDAPPSYTIETTFNLPADLQGGGIANAPGILMKQSEQARGTELAGLAVKVMNGYFVIGLSADDSDVQRNEQLLKDSSWFDIPIVYTNGVRAILAMEKGSRGDRTFAEAFSAWEKK